MNRFELEKRTKRFALKILEFSATLPHTRAGEIIEYQLVKAGTSVGSNYREANRAESLNDFIHKIGIVEKESSESLYWLELSEDASFGDAEKRRWLLREARELLAIFTSTSKHPKGIARSGVTNHLLKSLKRQGEITNPAFPQFRNFAFTTR